MFPGDFGDPAQDCNCRCTALTRARKALDEEELATMKERAKFFGLEEDKKQFFAEFKKKYLKAAKSLGNTGKSGIIKGKKINLQVFAQKTQHAEERSIARHVSDAEIDAVLSSPLHGVVITSWRTGTKIRKKYGKE